MQRKWQGIDSPYMEVIKNVFRETKVYLPVEMDDGSVHVFEDIVFSTRISADHSKVVFDIIRILH